MEVQAFVRPDLRQIRPGLDEDWCGHMHLTLITNMTTSATVRYTCRPCGAVFENIAREH